VTQPSKESRERNELRKFPMMPIRDMVIFPHMMTPFVVGRESSVRALEEALNGERKIFLATQHDARIDEPRPDEIFQVGTVGNIVQSVRMPDGNIKVLVEGIERARAVEITDSDGFFVATVKLAKPLPEVTPQIEQLVQRVTSLFEQYVKLQQSLNVETVASAIRTDEPSRLADTIAANLQLEVPDKQELLDIFDLPERLLKIADVLDIEIEKLNMDRSIQSRVKRQMERARRSTTSTRKLRRSRKSWAAAKKANLTS
jgi:ATP-dependent Lon protease